MIYGEGVRSPAFVIDALVVYYSPTYYLQGHTNETAILKKKEGVYSSRPPPVLSR